MANRIQIRRDTAANWLSVNPTLAQGELGYELNTGKLKVGNGINNWATLAYFNDGQDFSGNYADLTGAPTALSAFTNDSGFITAADIPDTGASDRLVNGAKEIVLDANGTLTVPYPSSDSFRIRLDSANFVPRPGKATLTLTGAAWDFYGAFAYSQDGQTELVVDTGPLPSVTNPGYEDGDSFEIDSTVHGIQGYVLTASLSNVVQSGPAGWTANLAFTPPPAYPSTITSLGAVKLTANTNSLVLGTDGSVTVSGVLKLPNNGIDSSIVGDNGLSITSQNGNQMSMIYNRAAILNPNPAYNANVAALFLDGTGATFEVNTDNTGNTWNFNTDGVFYGPLMGGLRVAGYVDAAKGSGLTLAPGQPADTTVTVRPTNTNGPTGVVFVDLTVSPEAANIPVGATFSVDGNPANNLSVTNSAAGNPGEWNLSLSGLFGVIQGDPYIVTYPGTNYNSVYVNTNSSSWEFRGDGALRQSNSFTKTSMSDITTTAPTVVWTASENFVSGAKLMIQVESSENGDSTGWHSQVCEAIIASRGYANSFGGPGGDPVMAVYGVTYTSTVPLVTFTVQRNLTTKFIEVVGTLTAAATPVANLRIYSVETATRD